MPCECVCLCAHSFAPSVRSLARHSIPFHFRRFCIFVNTNLCYCYICVAAFSLSLSLLFVSPIRFWIARGLCLYSVVQTIWSAFRYDWKPDARFNRWTKKIETKQEKTFADSPLFIGPQEGWGGKETWWCFVWRKLSTLSNLVGVVAAPFSSYRFTAISCVNRMNDRNEQRLFSISNHSQTSTSLMIHTRLAIWSSFLSESNIRIATFNHNVEIITSWFDQTWNIVGRNREIGCGSNVLVIKTETFGFVLRKFDLSQWQCVRFLVFCFISFPSMLMRFGGMEFDLLPKHKQFVIQIFVKKDPNLTAVVNQILSLIGFYGAKPMKTPKNEVFGRITNASK